ncbi:MAG TPA: energy transducer TonB, partial [Leeuwenhoekiella sp.]|nr:energy transducer TonB [Leeuwenhoekiella sp.]
MEPKKNPKKDLSRRSVLFLQLGLILILGLSYVAIEWKTYDKEAIDIGKLNVDDVLEEDVPITELNT